MNFSYEDRNFKLLLNLFYINKNILFLFFKYYISVYFNRRNARMSIWVDDFLLYKKKAKYYYIPIWTKNWSRDYLYV